MIQRIFRIEPHSPQPIIGTRLDDLPIARVQQRLLQLLVLRELQKIPFFHHAIAVGVPDLLIEVGHLAAQLFRLCGRLGLQDAVGDAAVRHQQGFVVHHVLLRGVEGVLLAGCGIVFVENRRVPLLQRAFGLGPVEPEEEHVFVRDFGREFLRVVELGGKGGEVVADPAWASAVGRHVFVDDLRSTFWAFC